MTRARRVRPGRSSAGGGGFACLVLTIFVLGVGGAVARGGAGQAHSGRLAALRDRLDHLPDDARQAGPALREVAAEAGAVMRRAGEPGPRLAAARIALRAAYTRARLAVDAAGGPPALDAPGGAEGAKTPGAPHDAARHDVPGPDDAIDALHARATEVERLGAPGAEALGAFWSMAGRMLDLARSTTTPRPMRQAVVAKLLESYLQRYAGQASTPARLTAAVRLGLARVADQAGDQAAAAAQARALVAGGETDPPVIAILQRAALVGRPLGVDLPATTRGALIFDPRRGPDPAMVAGIDRRLRGRSPTGRDAEHRGGGEKKSAAAAGGVIALAYGKGYRGSTILPVRQVAPGASAAIDTIARAGLPRLVRLSGGGRIEAIGATAAALDPAPGPGPAHAPGPTDRAPPRAFAPAVR